MASDASSASAATLAEFITNVRADNGKPLTPVTARTYAACLVRIRGLIGGDPMHYQWPVQDKPALDKALLSIPLTSRKTCLCALLAWSKTVMSKPGDVVEYIQTLVNEVVEQCRSEEDAQQPTQKQTDNWTSLAELKTVLKGYERELKNDGVLTGRGVLPSHTFRLLRRWVIGMLYLSGDDNPPLRLDFRDVRLIDRKAWMQMPVADREGKNWLVITGRNKKVFVFGRYKTFATHGVLEVPVGKPLNRVLNIWFRYHKSDYLLDRFPLAASRMTELIKSVFSPTSKRIGVSMLRHIYLSSKFPADLAHRQDIARKMAHSVDQQSLYILDVKTDGAQSAPGDALSSSQ